MAYSTGTHGPGFYPRAILRAESEALTTTTVERLLGLDGKIAIVTGAAVGIGKAIAARLAEAGATVVIADLDEVAARRTAEQIEQARGRGLPLRTDVSDVAQLTQLVDRTVQKFGRLDILVNNAGIFPFSQALETTPELWDRVLAVNLRGSFFLAQTVAKAMRAGGAEGAIVNVTSIDALHPSGSLTPYDASKGGLLMLTRSQALEFAPLPTRVNAVAPGGINTPGASEATSSLLRAAGLTGEEFAKGFQARIPLGRMGEPDDIARSVLFLAGPAAESIPGAQLVVDGGYLLT